MRYCSCHTWRLLFRPAKAVQKGVADLLHSYCLGRERYIQAFTRTEMFYYSVIAIASFSCQID